MPRERKRLRIDRGSEQECETVVQVTSPFSGTRRATGCRVGTQKTVRWMEEGREDSGINHRPVSFLPLTAVSTAANRVELRSSTASSRSGGERLFRAVQCFPVGNASIRSSGRGYGDRSNDRALSICRRAGLAVDSPGIRRLPRGKEWPDRAER